MLKLWSQTDASAGWQGLEQITFLLQKWIMSTLLRGLLRGLTAIKYLVFKVFSSECGMYEAFIKW